EDFRVAQGSGTAPDQLFSRTFVLGDFLDPHGASFHPATALSEAQSFSPVAGAAVSGRFGFSPALKATTCAAIATPPGTGAVALIRLGGPAAKRLAANCFVGREAERWEARRQHFGRLVGADGQAIDEVLLTWFPGPRSFTGEEVV